MSLTNFELLTKIGEGAYSVVYKARRLSDSKIYAIKKVKIQKLSEKEKKNALSEIRIMASIKHPNIISYKEAFFDESDQSLCLIMEYADAGDLWQRVQRCLKRGTRLNEKTIWSILIQITRGLHCLHEIGVLHRDMKSANVFLNKDGSVKLGDMNVSKVAKDGFLKTQTGTPYYASPEVWKDMKYNYKSDIWSLGCVLYEAITLRPPFLAKDMEELFEKVTAGLIDPIPKSYSRDLSVLVKLLLNTNPNERLSCGQILGLEFVKKRVNSLVQTSSTCNLLNPIKIPKDLKMLSYSLPRADYGGFAGIKDRLDTEELADKVEELKTTHKQTNNKMHSSMVIESMDTANDSLKLPQLKVKSVTRNKNYEVNRMIEKSNERLQRIREVYLNPVNILLTPQHKKLNKKVTSKRHLFYP
jgi:NIMA (never in mitosis gene a)-related kinase 1/4/5